MGNTDQIDRPIDGRDRRKGNWSYCENVLYTFFLPIVGKEATHLYQVLTYLLPVQARSPEDFDLTQRLICKRAGMSLGAVNKQLDLLLRCGMLTKECVSGRDQFFLEDLSELAELGRSEIVLRLPAWAVKAYEKRRVWKTSKTTGKSVHGVNEGDDDEGPDSSSGEVDKDAPDGDCPSLAQVPDADDVSDAATAPKPPHSSPVHVVNGAEARENGNPAFTKEGGSVHQNGDLVHQNGVFVHPGEHLFKEEFKDELTTPPYPPQAGGGVLDKISASADVLEPPAETTLVDLMLDQRRRDQWQAVLGELAPRINRGTIDTWLRPCRIVGTQTPGERDDGCHVVIIGLPSNEFIDVVKRYEDAIVWALERRGMENPRVVLRAPKPQTLADERPESRLELDPGLTTSQAADAVMRECRVVDRRLGDVIAEQFRLAPAQTPAAAAQLMIAEWREYTRTSHLREINYGIRKFIALGIWADRQQWRTRQQRRL